MRTIFFAILFLTGSIIFISCKKETVVSNPPPPPPPVAVNKPPIANAGRDTTISLPNSAIWLDGSASYSANNKIASYLWEQISGPLFYQHSILSKKAVSTSANIHVAGTYQFQLTITDIKGLSSKDTVDVVLKDYTNPPQLTGQEITFNSLTWMEEFDDDYKVFFNTPPRADLLLHDYIKVEVLLKPDSTAGWIRIKPWFEYGNTSDYYYYRIVYDPIIGNSLSVDMWPPDRTLVGKKASIKLKFL